MLTFSIYAIRQMNRQKIDRQLGKYICRWIENTIDRQMNGYNRFAQQIRLTFSSYRANKQKCQMILKYLNSLFKIKYCLEAQDCNSSLFENL